MAGWKTTESRRCCQESNYLTWCEADVSGVFLETLQVKTKERSFETGYCEVSLTESSRSAVHLFDRRVGAYIT